MENLEGEVWAEVEGYGGIYEISTHGRTGSYRSPGNQYSNKNFSPERKILKNVLLTGYHAVCLHDINGKQKTVKVHRLVAIAFIPNPENKPWVNHKDLDRTNNHISNLEWSTIRENTYHGLANRKSSSKYWGVYFCKNCPNNPWRAEIKINGVRMDLGSHPTEYAAHLVVEATFKKYGIVNKYNKPKGDSNLESPNG